MTTAAGAERRTLGAFTLAMINVAAICSLRSLPGMAEYGLALAFYYVVAAVLFLIPTSLVSAELFDFRDKYEANAPLDEIFPDLTAAHPAVYRGLGLRDFCDRMHQRLKDDHLVSVMHDIYAVMPEQAMIPGQAYDALVRGRVEPVRVEDLLGRISAVMVVPYPPGIPVIMPGERFTEDTIKIIDYLAWGQDFDNHYPGFENEMHGVVLADDGAGGRAYTVNCLID